MKYLILTGATGLVGRYLLRDLLARDVPVAVLARGNRAESAAERIESIMRRWESLACRSLPRPVVLAADLREPGIGIAATDLTWIAENCDRVLHNAASMTFREDKHGEPMRTNVDGMKNMLELCKKTGIRKFHHVSTAYVCGLRTGRVFEQELDLGQQNGNVYEVSKLAAEKMVRAADFLDQVTVYRPASVAGDSQTGYTTSTHGFYLPLQLAFVIADRIPSHAMGERFLKLLGLTGNEGKNLVPVDWLAAAIVALVCRPEHHGGTYHMTNPQPVTVKLIQEVVQEAIEQFSTRRFLGTLSEEEITAYEDQFRGHMEVYRSHWRDDPVFDRTNIARALPELPCPAIDREMLLRIAAYPVKQNFILKRSEPAPVDFHPGEHLLRLVDPKTALGGDGAQADTVGFQITGSGGGPWRLQLRQDDIFAVERGLGPRDRARIYLNSNTFASLVHGRSSVEQSLKSGHVVIEDDSQQGGARADLVRILKRVVTRR